jgi:hypothetical protein
LANEDQRKLDWHPWLQAERHGQLSDADACKRFINQNRSSSESLYGKKIIYMIQGDNFEEDYILACLPVLHGTVHQRHSGRRIRIDMA